ncbi:MAG: hypothetical protein A2W85_18480 [Bacteroidetes bacterium GWF2_41_31]|nr:MAG: hypothetical protein A2W85_18480 [Bacteroidetes bacterium GWF2_41_31]
MKKTTALIFLILTGSKLFSQVGDPIIFDKARLDINNIEVGINTNGNLFIGLTIPATLNLVMNSLKEVASIHFSIPLCGLEA